MAAPIGVSGLGKHEFKCEATAGLAKSRAVRAEAEAEGEEVPAQPCASLT